MAPATVMERGLKKYGGDESQVVNEIQKRRKRSLTTVPIGLITKNRGWGGGGQPKGYRGNK